MEDFSLLVAFWLKLGIEPADEGGAYRFQRVRAPPRRQTRPTTGGPGVAHGRPPPPRGKTRRELPHGAADQHQRRGVQRPPPARGDAELDDAIDGEAGLGAA